MSTPQKVKFIENHIWKKNKSIREIAEIMGLSYAGIRWYIDRYDIKKKTRLQALKDARDTRNNGRSFNWKGGHTNVHGYNQIYKPDHPNAYKSGYLSEHRYIMSEKLKRPLKDYEVVHHIDGNKLNNNPTNLQLMTMGGRNKYHGIPIHCPKCGYELNHHFLE